MARIDQRKSTVRYTCPEDRVEGAISAARHTGVTLQKIEVVGYRKSGDMYSGLTASVREVREAIEEYPVLFLADHGMIWEATKAAGNS